MTRPIARTVRRRGRSRRAGSRRPGCRSPLPPTAQVAKVAPQKLPVAWPRDELVVAGVIGVGVEPDVAADTLQADLRGVGGLERQIGIADLEGLLRVVRTAGEQFQRARRALDPLQRQARLQIGGADRLMTPTLRLVGRKSDRDGELAGAFGGGEIVRRKSKRGAGDIDGFDAGGKLSAQRVGVTHLFEEISGGGRGLGRQQDCLAKRVEALIGALQADDAGQRAERVATGWLSTSSLPSVWRFLNVAPMVWKFPKAVWLRSISSCR